jgi:hypothetical protein
MKNSMFWLSVLISLTCGFLLFIRESELRKIRAQLAAESEQRAQAAQEIAAQEGKLALVSDDLRRAKLGRMHAEASLQGLAHQAALGTAERKTNSATVSDFMRRQAVKELMKEEATAGTAKEINALFKSGLAGCLNLDEQQSAKLKQLLTTKSEITWQQFLLPLFSGELDERAMAAAGNTIRAALEENASQMNAILGEEGVARCDAFTKTQPERERLTQFSPSFEQMGAPLSPDQKNQLLAAMTGERLSYKFDEDFSDPLKLDLEHWYDNFTQEKFEHYNTQEQELNARILQRAQAILSSAQLERLNKLMADQLLRSEMTVQTTMALTSAARAGK